MGNIGEWARKLLDVGPYNGLVGCTHLHNSYLLISPTLPNLSMKVSKLEDHELELWGLSKA